MDIINRSAEEENELWRQYHVFKDLERRAEQSQQPHILGVTCSGKFTVLFPEDERFVAEHGADKKPITAAMEELPGKFRKRYTISEYLAIKEKKQAELEVRRLTKEKEIRMRFEQERKKAEKVRRENEIKRQPMYSNVTKMKKYSGARRHESSDAFKIQQIDRLRPGPSNQ